MREDARLLSVPWIAGLDTAVRDALVARGRWRRLADGEWLYGEGDEDTGVVAVIEGALLLHAQAPGGREVLFSLLPAGAAMGQSLAFGGGPRLVTAIAAGETLLFTLSDSALRQVAAEHPGLWQALSGLVYGQLRGAIQGLADFVALKPRERLIARLLGFSAFANPVRLSQAALAEMVAATRPAVNGWLRALEDAGVLALGYGRIEVLDRRLLARMLEVDD